jgi:cytoskeleton protein RodZ
MTNPTIGEQLRKARTAQSRDLSQIADETKISKYYLEAIEADQIERLPGLFFYKAFVRQYSKLLKLDGKKLEAQINADHGTPEVTVEEVPPSRLPMFRRQPALRGANSVGGDMRLVLAGLGLIAVLVGGSAVYTWMQRPAPAVITETRHVYVPSSPGGKPASAVQGGGEVAGAPQAGPGFRSVADNLTPEAGPDSSVALSLSATEATWITITSDGKVVYTGILEPQQSKSLAGRQKVMIKVGNAAGLEVKWNGKAVGRLGDQKQVRTILFTDKEYQIVTPPAPATGSANPVSD